MISLSYIGRSLITSCSITRHCIRRCSQKTTTSQKEINKIRRYALSRYMQFVQGYETLLEKKFPAALRTYRIFTAGIKDFYRDLKSFFQISMQIHTALRDRALLSRGELELYHKMKKDIVKVAPMLFLSVLPFTNYIVLPMVYLFPRQLLCSHFWTIQQRVEFDVHNLRSRLYHCRPVFRALQAQLDNIEDESLHKPWARILSLIGSGVHPKTEDIVKCIDLFKGHPYHILYLYTGHVRHLLKMHGMHVGWRRRYRLSDRARIIHEMDMAILREGGVKAMSHDQLRWACFLRGLNPVNVKEDDLIEWINNWIVVSKHVDENSLSLLLHCPILLAYNQPGNWALIY
ncbi:LETM1 domain-containing protein 1 [Schistocerca serialis cubense]|uniref:LETM1 domain-containing protein 1 n=1 Tax=Schistocerca serialis cubense TaxID=2023355 RepID=UPI00214F1CF9|nr:LETM1 domain-containing protein 1 [Schistocerca serialis cubense]